MLPGRCCHHITLWTRLSFMNLLLYLLFMFQLLLQLCSELSLIYQLTDNKSNCPVLGKRAGQNFHNCSIKYRANVCLFIYSKFSSLYLSKDYNSSFGNGIMMSVHIQVSRLPQTPTYSSPGRPSTCYKNISRYRTAHLDIWIQWFHEFVCDFLVKLLNYTKQFIHYITYIFFVASAKLANRDFMFFSDHLQNLIIISALERGFWGLIKQQIIDDSQFASIFQELIFAIILFSMCSIGTLIFIFP